MKALIFALLVTSYGIAVRSAVVTESDQIVEEVQSTVAPVDVSSGELQNSALSEPIDRAKQLLLALDEQVKQMLPSDAENVASEVDATPQVYAAVDSSIMSEEGVGRQMNQINNLLDQIDVLEKRLQSTIQSLSDRRRYVLSSMLRPTLNYVQRVHQNLERLHSRLTTGKYVNGVRQAGGIIDQSAIDNIRIRVEEINRTVNDILGRIWNSLGIRLSPTSNQASSSAPASSSTASP